MDRAKPLPTLPALEAQEVRELLATLPRTIILDTERDLKAFFEALKRPSWEPDGDWMEELVRYLLEYVADLPSSEELLQDYAQQVVHEMESKGIPFPDGYLYACVLAFGTALRRQLERIGLYRYKGAMLYKFSRFDAFDIILVPLDPAEIPWVNSHTQGEPGWRQL